MIIHDIDRICWIEVNIKIQLMARLWRPAGRNIKYRSIQPRQHCRKTSHGGLIAVVPLYAGGWYSRGPVLVNLDTGHHAPGRSRGACIITSPLVQSAVHRQGIPNPQTGWCHPEQPAEGQPRAWPGPHHEGEVQQGRQLLWLRWLLLHLLCPLPKQVVPEGRLLIHQRWARGNGLLNRLHGLLMVDPPAVAN